MKKYSILRIPTMSFFSKDLYIDIARNFKGLNFLYLLLLLAICWIPPMIKMHVGVTDFVNNEAPVMIDQIPEITITDGRVSIDQPEPYYISNPDTNEPLAIIDTTGQYTSLEDSNAFCLLTENKLIMRQSNIEKRTYDLSNIKDFTVNSEKVTGWLNIFSKIIVPVSYPFALIGSYIYRIIQALIYASLGLLFASICKTHLSYAALIRLAIAAVTPCIIVATILNLVSVSIPSFLYPAAALAYLFFAVKSIADTPEIIEEDQIIEIEPTVWDKHQNQ
jgi:hypothetical protein